MAYSIETTLGKRLTKPLSTDNTFFACSLATDSQAPVGKRNADIAKWFADLRLMNIANSLTPWGETAVDAPKEDGRGILAPLTVGRPSTPLPFRRAALRRTTLKPQLQGTIRASRGEVNVIEEEHLGPAAHRDDHVALKFPIGDTEQPVIV